LLEVALQRAFLALPIEINQKTWIVGTREVCMCFPDF
jgi:hypothetical protein